MSSQSVELSTNQITAPRHVFKPQHYYPRLFKSVPITYNKFFIFHSLFPFFISVFLNSAVEVFLLNLIRLMILNSYHVWLQCGLHDHSSILNLYYKYNRFSVNRNNSQRDASVQNFEVKASA